MRALVLFALLSLVVAAPAFAEDTFEARATGAQRVGRIESLVWALTAACDNGDDTHQRQCRRVRDARAAELTGPTLLLDADNDAFDVGAWSAQKKSVPVTLSACIRCAGVDIDGKTFFIVTDKDLNPPKFEGGKLKTGPMSDTAKQFADEAAAKAYARSVSNARVQVLVKVPRQRASSMLKVDGKSVIALDLVGYRVYAPCDGSIAVASPKSGPAEADKKQCAAVAPIAEVKEPPKLDQLTAALISTGMKPVVDDAGECFKKFGVAGKAKLKITIGGDGAVAKYEQQGDFANTPTGQCIDAAMTKAKFPASKKQKTVISFPIVLQ
ncbi:MAG TPA: hypothetical protein VIV11_17240 [Kofleriaceae bacterium]